MNKEKKKIILIVIGVILVIVLACFVGIAIVEKNSNVETTKLQDILNDSLEIKTFIDGEKNIELISFTAEENTDNVKIWAFSEPIYLGEFKLVKKDNKYYLEGLNDILKQKDLNVGTHRLLMMQDDKSLGYIKIEIDDDKSLKSTLLNDNDENMDSYETTNESDSNAYYNNTSISNANKNQTDKTEINKNTSITDDKKEETTKPTNNVQDEEPKQEETPKKDGSVTNPDIGKKSIFDKGKEYLSKLTSNPGNLYNAVETGKYLLANKATNDIFKIKAPNFVVSPKHTSYQVMDNLA